MKKGYVKLWNNEQKKKVEKKEKLKEKKEGRNGSELKGKLNKN